MKNSSIENPKAMEIADLADLYGKELHVKQISKWLRGSARTQAIKERSHLDDTNGEIIDEHDQFYKDHKLLLALFRVTRFFVQFIFKTKNSR